MKYIDTARFCQEQLSGEGELTPLDLPRFAAEVLPSSDFRVAWQAQGQAPNFLELSLKSVVQLECQRCLHAMAHEVNVRYRFQFVADEATAQLADEENDEVDALVHAKQFDLSALIEDELLMALPLVTLHDQCPQAGALAYQPQPERLSPFAALEKLKSVA